MKFVEVARWEFLEKVKSKAFLISLVLMPIIMVTFGVVPGLLAAKGDDKTITVGIIDQSHSIYSLLAKRLDEKYRLPDDQPNYTLRDLASEEDGTPEQLKAYSNQLVAGGDIEGYFTIPPAVYDSGKVEYRSDNVGNFRILESFSRTIEDVIMEKKLTDRGFDPKLLSQVHTSVNVKPIKISKEGEEKETDFMQTFFSAYIFVMMLMFLVLTSGQLMIRSVVEEKSNRVIEVLLSSCSTTDLMVGKILGLSGLGILQVLIWGAIGLAISLKTGSTAFVSVNLLLSSVYFILGYTMFAAIFVGLGSPVTTEQEAQQITTYVSLTLVFPIVLAVPMMQNPDSLLIKILTFFPLMTPSFMLMRIPIKMPELWEILTTVGILIVATILCMWAAGKIFRIAILVYGKRPSLGELVQWIRTPY
jgi:ABC-2 type transport system permease protein